MPPRRRRTRRLRLLIERRQQQLPLDALRRIRSGRRHDEFDQCAELQVEAGVRAPASAGRRRPASQVQPSA